MHTFRVPSEAGARVSRLVTLFARPRQGSRPSNREVHPGGPGSFVGWYRGRDPFCNTSFSAWSATLHSQVARWDGFGILRKQFIVIAKRLRSIGAGTASGIGPKVYCWVEGFDFDSLSTRQAGRYSAVLVETFDLLGDEVEWLFPSHSALRSVQVSKYGISRLQRVEWTG
jgi:hypothetical protein